MATRPIDEKIVVMKLDNSDFTKNAAETTTLFGKLRDSLSKVPSINLGKTAEELGAISTAANPTSIDRLAESVNKVSSHFSALKVMATTALATVTSMATAAGVSLAKSMTLDQVTSGFNEYELKIKSIGTMLSNTEWAGSTLDDVKKTLADLNAYADQTVYSFGDMTENIGRFTAAGVKLEDSAIAIKGLGNLAAASGSGVEQLNMAMYQSSQALASGKLNLEDWNSLVNAGMAGKKTQDALVQTAKEMGKNVDLSEGFRNSIQKGWLTSEVFLKTLQKFGADKSMTEAATSVRTFSGMMDSLKESIGSGWATTFEQIFGDFNEATKFWTGMSNSINGWFNDTANARNKLMTGIADKGGFQNIFSGIGNAVKPVIQVFQAMGDGFRKVFPPASVATIVNLTERFKDFTKGLSLSKSTVTNLTTVFQGAFSIFSTVWEIVKQLGSAFLNLIPGGVGGGILGILAPVAKLAIAFNNSVKEGNALTEAIGGLGNILGGIGKIIGTTIRLLSNFSSSIADNIGKAVDWIKEKLAPVGQFFKDTFGGGAIGGDEILGAGTLVALFAIVKKISGFFDNASGIVDSAKEVFEGVGDAVNNFANGIKYVNLLTIAVALGILAVSLKTIEGIKAEDIAKGITALAISLGVMIAGMTIMDKFNVTGGLRASTTIIGLALAVSIMALALKKISDINPQQLAIGIGGLVAITIALAGAVIAMSKWGGKIGTSSIQLLALSGAIYILASAVNKMSSIDTGSLFTSIGALGVIFTELAIFLKVVNKSKFSISSAIGVLAVAGAIQIMASAIQKISTIKYTSLIKGLGAIAIILTEIAIFSKIASGSSLVGAGIGIVLIATAINMLVGPIQALGNMSWGKLAKGLGVMAITLAAVATAAILMSGSIGGALSLVVMAAALNMLIIPIKAFGSMTWGDLITGFVGVAGGLALLAGASILLTPAVPSMLAFGAGLLLMGVAILAAGAGLALFGTGLAALGTLTATSIAAIVSSLSLLIQSLASLIPGAVNFVVQLASALISGLVTLVPALVEGLVTIIVKLLQTLAAHIPDFITAGANILLGIINGLGIHVPRLVNAGLNLMVNLINGMSNAIKNNGPLLVSSVLNLIGEILIVVINAQTQMVNALFGWIPGIQSVTGKIGSTAEKYIRDNFGAKEVGNKKGSEFAGALSGKAGEAKNAGSKVGSAGKDGANGASLSAVGAKKGAEFASAISSKSGAAKSAGSNLANSGKSGASSVKMDTTGGWFGQGFANGISGKFDAVYSAAKKLALAAKDSVVKWIDSHSPSKVSQSLGGFFGEGFALGISDKIKRVGGSAKDIALTAMNSLNNVIDGFETPSIDNELHFKAVVDYDKLNVNGFGKIAPLNIIPDTSLTASMIPAIAPQSSNPNVISQNNDNIEMIKRQDQQIDILRKQIDLLSSISGKDNNVYLDGKELYNSNKKFQDNQTNIRNIFKGVSTV